MSSIQVHVSEENPIDWGTKIHRFEKDLLNRYLVEVEPFDRLGKQYEWFKRPYPQTDAFYYLSVLQHFGCPTRLCDFTSDFWIAVFFACYRADENHAPCVYRLKCQNADESNKGGNKVPRMPGGSCWSSCDINSLLGYLIGFRGFENPSEPIRKDIDCYLRKERGGQMYGWDQPYFGNAKIDAQRGFFVYPVDVASPLGDVIEKDPSAELVQFRISTKLIHKVKEELKERDLIEWKVYLDLDRVFSSWFS